MEFRSGVCLYLFTLMCVFVFVYFSSFFLDKYKKIINNLIFLSWSVCFIFFFFFLGPCVFLFLLGSCVCVCICFLCQNGTIVLLIEIYINLLLFRKYVGIYHFLDNRVFHGTQVPWKNFPTNLKATFSKNSSFMNSSTIKNPSSPNSST